MLKRIYLLVFTVFLLTSNVYAGYSLRRCLILPITDSLKGSVGSSVFDRVESYLKESNWCYYQSNSGLIDILNRYQHKLSTYLKNPNVLKVIARKTEAGSLISLGIHTTSAGILFELYVYGENGKDIYYHEKVLYHSVDTDVMAQAAINWLEEYNKSIPFDVRISGILGDSFTVDMGRATGLNAGDEIEFIRPTKKKRHPLFKEIVDWETKPIAQGKIVHVTELQSQGKITRYHNLKDKIKIEDWGLIKKSSKLDPNHKSTVEGSKYSFGKLGELTFEGSINQFSVSVNNTAGTKRQKGLLFGGKVDSELWITRAYWVGFHINFATGSVSKDVGSFAIEDNSLYTVKYRLKVGYKYLPLGFFYGPQIDFFIAYEQDNIALDNNVADKIVGVTYSGFVIGTKANIPLYKKFRLYVHFDFVLLSGFKEDVKIFGDPSGVSSYQFKFGMSYSREINTKFFLGMDLKSSKADYESINTNIAHRRISLVSGVKFTF